MRGPQILRRALIAPLQLRWLSLTLFLIGGVLVAGPLIVAEVLSGGSLAGRGDPVLAQHLLWMFGAPETAILIAGLAVLLGSGLVLARMGKHLHPSDAGGGTGWARVWRYTLVTWLAALGLLPDSVVFALWPGMPFALDAILRTLGTIFALYLLFRLAPALESIRSERALRLGAAWRASGPQWRRGLGLAIALVLIGSLIIGVAQIAAVFLVPGVVFDLGQMPIWLFSAMTRTVPLLLSTLAVVYVLMAIFVAAWLSAVMQPPA